MTFENTQNKLDELRNLTWQNGKLIEQNQQLLDQLENGAGAIGSEIMVGKQSLVDAIEYKGGTSSADKTLKGIAEDIKEIPNFNTSGCEYISEVYKPTTLLEAYYNRIYLKSVIDNDVEEISGAYTFSGCSSLQSVRLPNLVTISGDYTFSGCSSLQSVRLPNLVTLRGSHTFQSCPLLQNVELPNLVTLSGTYMFQSSPLLQSVRLPNLVTLSGIYTFNGCPLLQTITLGILVVCKELFSDAKPNLRNITIGQDTDIDLPFQYWTATNVIAEGQSGIDELNSNLYNNLLTKLYDHSQDGQTRTLRLGWLAHVTQENIDYANSKGWTLTT
jgi:hypothetical protein